MSAHPPQHLHTVPRGAILAASLFVLSTIAMTGAVQAGLIASPPEASEARAAAGTPAIADRLLLFADMPDGTVRISNAATGAPVATLVREDGGFIRGVMRGLARERRMHGVGAAAPFRLTLWDDGALSLTDPETGRIVELNGFGPSNRGAFLRLLGRSPS